MKKDNHDAATVNNKRFCNVGWPKLSFKDLDKNFRPHFSGGDGWNGGENG